jgi:RNA polymerase sigma factor (sigma-70 family)
MNPFILHHNSATQSIPGSAESTDTSLVQQAQAGDMAALDALFQCHWPAFRRHAELVCGDSTAAMDICQEACLKAVHCLSRFAAGGNFRSWVFGFINHEAWHWKRNLKKVCTRTDGIGNYIVETMSAKTLNESQQDMRVLLDLLRERAYGMSCRRRQVASFMLDYYGEQHELPTIRAIASATQTSQGAAQIYHEEVLASWCRFLAAVEIGLPRNAGSIPRSKSTRQPSQL